MIIKFNLFESTNYGNKFLISEIEENEQSKVQVRDVLNDILKGKYVDFYTALGKKRKKYIVKVTAGMFSEGRYVLHTNDGSKYVINEEYPIEIVSGPDIRITDDDPYGEEDWGG